jgi:hypothetical protein
MRATPPPRASEYAGPVAADATCSDLGFTDCLLV